MLASRADTNFCQCASCVRRTECNCEAKSNTLPDYIIWSQYGGTVGNNYLRHNTDALITATTPIYPIHTNYDHWSITNHGGNTLRCCTPSTNADHIHLATSITLHIHLTTNCKPTITKDIPTTLNETFSMHFIPTTISNHASTTSPSQTTTFIRHKSNHSLASHDTQTTNHVRSKYTSFSKYILLTRQIQNCSSIGELIPARKPNLFRNIGLTTCYFRKADHLKKTICTRGDLHMPICPAFSSVPSPSTNIIHAIAEGHSNSGGQGNSQGHVRSQGHGKSKEFRSAHEFCSRKGGMTWVRVLLTILATLPTLAEGGYGHSANSLGRHGHPANNLEGYSISRQGKKDIFVHDNKSEVVAAQSGATASLHCRLTSPLADGMVSWVRRRNYQVLTVGRAVYSSDVRLGVEVSIDGRDWVLTIRYVTTQDAGLYECQVSSHPPQATVVNLNVVEAHAEIVGGPERYIHHGSSLMLVCLLKGATEAPVYVFWYRGHRMINYDTEHGVTVDNSRQASKLYMSSVSRQEEGNYTCVPSNAAQASVSVIIIQKENPAGLQQETNMEKETSSPSPSSTVLPSVVVLLFLLPLLFPTFIFPFNCHIFR